jgi:hypothetical protein
MPEKQPFNASCSPLITQQKEKGGLERPPFDYCFVAADKQKGAASAMLTALLNAKRI